jgi:hypothetical protein
VGFFFLVQNDHLYWLLTVQYLVQIANYRIFGKYLEFLFFILIYLIFFGDLNWLCWELTLSLMLSPINLTKNDQNLNFLFLFFIQFYFIYFLQNADLNESIKKIIWFILEKRLKEARILKFLPFIPKCSSLWVTHDISNPLPMVYPTPYPWYIAPPTHDILNPRPMVYRTPLFW